jgi:pimeloyl-ACP methyl ester carboxylesterase
MATITTDDGVDLHYEITGTGPALLLIHGITESSDAWAPVVPRFAADRERFVQNIVEGSAVLDARFEIGCAGLQIVV